ncbi:extracellular solute-binding protein [Streptomyces sp. NPDC046900]|uniref:ABC transporter substrate-binding protein n=1 Tax=Streptomyces sp. NPDC046900 TaxID=3155473 RepID=UPI0033E7A010
MKTRLTVTFMAMSALLLAGCGSSFNNSTHSSAQGTDKGPLTLLFGSSGPAETTAVKNAAAAYTKQTGIKVTVMPSQNQTQQLSQGFAANKPPDLFYLDPATFQNYAKRGSLDAYAQKRSDVNDFYQPLRQAFTYKSRFYCMPKDWGSLALVVRKDDWTQAGLTTKDVPTTWAQLEQVAKKLTTSGRAGLSLPPSHSGMDEFLYQAGGSILNANGTQAVIDSPQNVQALTFLKKLMNEGVLKLPTQLDSGWEGEAFGKNKASMIITGPWLTGAMSSDFPSVKYQVYPLPAGPGGDRGTLAFTNCWGIPANGAHTAAAEKFVDFLTKPGQELTFAKAFGPIPPRQSASAQWAKEFPADQAFADAADAHPDIALPGAQEAIADFDSKLAQLATSDPKTLLASVQTNLQTLIGQNK